MHQILENLWINYLEQQQKLKINFLNFFIVFEHFLLVIHNQHIMLMTTRGCGYAVDDEPTIYNKQANIVSKIKGGDDAIWHTW